jgi:DNA polymerase-3 subunit epsilon
MWAVIDLESTGVDVKDDRVVEFAIVIYEPKQKKVINMVSNLVFTEGMKKSSEEAFACHGINDFMLKEHGMSHDEMCELIKAYVEVSKVTHFVAHNGTMFDVPMLQMEYLRLSMTMPVIPLIDSVTDIPWPKGTKSKSLNYAAADHGFVNPWQHRALPDCLTLIRLLGQYDYSEIEKRAASPTISVLANVSYEDRELAKKAGFYWQPERKQWKKSLKLFEYEAESKTYPFSVQQEMAT